MKKEKLDFIDDMIYTFLENNVGRMPKRAVKMIARYYADARIRKMYWAKLGVFMKEGTYPNLGFESTSNGRPLVFIGKNVSIAPYVTMIPVSDANNGEEINTIPYVAEVLTKTSPIIIEDDVWIGTQVTILPGVTVGRCTVIGAGSIVTKDLEPYSVYAGTPAKKIRDLKEGKYGDKQGEV